MNLLFFVAFKLCCHNLQIYFKCIGIPDPFFSDMLSETDELPPCPVGDDNYGSETELIAGLTCKEVETTKLEPQPVLGNV